MDVAEPAPPDAASLDQGETFCQYLAKHLVARQGFVAGFPPEAREVAEQSDYVFTDSNSSVTIGLIDREAHPEKAFTLSAARVREIAEDCRVSADRAGRATEAISVHAIHLMEVGAATPEQPARLGDITPRFLDNIVAAWTIDPQRGTIWTTAGRHGRALQNFVQKLLGAPREAVVAPVAAAPRSFPWLTAAIIAVLAAIYAAEIAFGHDGTEWLTPPTVKTLIAFGGLVRTLVTESAEWYRLFTAPLLHADVTHIAFNAVALGIAGYVLEPLIGRAWFAALFVIGALCGALFSLAFNTDNVVAVGASGAVMALFACMLSLSGHFPKGATRTWLQLSAVEVLVPSLLPLMPALNGAKIDYAAHFGGAFGGAAVGLVLLALWPADEIRPRLRHVALGIGAAGLAACLVAGALARQNHLVDDLRAALAPDHHIPTSEDAWRRIPGNVFTRYPRDPRVQFIRASILHRTGDKEGAEQALRAGLAEEAVWRRIFRDGDLAARVHTLLAQILAEDGRRDEAREVAKPVCRAGAAFPMRAALDRQNLCAN